MPTYVFLARNTATTISPYPFDGDVSELNSTSAGSALGLAAVATSNDYNDLDNKPSIPAVPTLAGSTYTPTRSAESNLDSNVTMTEAQYMRVANTVTVSGRFTADPTLTATATSFEFSLPVSSNLGAAEDLAGVAFCGAIAGQGATIIGSAANNTAVVQWVSSDVTSQTWSFTFTYQVI